MDIYKELNGWVITNWGGVVDFEVHNKDHTVEIDSPDKFGDVLIEHDGCFGRDGCSVSRVNIPVDILIEYVRTLGYEVTKKETR